MSKQGFPEDVPPSKVRRANQELRRWLNGEVDKVECFTLPSGERIIDSFNRDADTS